MAPLGLAASVGTALVVDCDAQAPTYPGRNVAELADLGLRRVDLLPARRGVAVLGNGGLDLDSVMDIVGHLRRGWPSIVLRAGVFDPPGVPVIPAIVLLPDPLTPKVDGPCLAQRIGRSSGSIDGGIMLPPLSRSQLVAMMSSRINPRWRWVKAFRRVWDLPWH